MYLWFLNIEEFRNSHGGAPSAGTGSSYLCYSNCDGIPHDAVTIARMINEAVKDSY